MLSRDTVGYSLLIQNKKGVRLRKYKTLQIADKVYNNITRRSITQQRNKKNDR